MPLGMEVVLGPGHIVLDEDSAPHRGNAPQFSARVCTPNDWMDQDSTFFRKADLCPDDIVLDGDPAPPRGHSPSSSFRPMSVVAKWMDGSRCHLVRR